MKSVFNSQQWCDPIRPIFFLNHLILFKKLQLILYFICYLLHFLFTDKLEVSYSRSSGPGGQNVNCVSTKAEIRFQISTADWIPEPIRCKLAEKMKNQITKEGYLVTKSDRTRSQQLNLADAMDKLRDLIFSAAESLVVRESSPESIERHRRL